MCGDPRNQNIILLLSHNCNFAIIINYIWYARYLICDQCEGHKPQIENLDYTLKSTSKIIDIWQIVIYHTM